jgi:hypothetical protein
MQHAKRRIRIIFSPVDRQNLQYFFHIISQTARFSEKKKFEQKMRVLIFPATFVRNISHSKKNWARCDLKCTWVFMPSTRYSCRIFAKTQISN